MIAVSAHDFQTTLVTSEYHEKFRDETREFLAPPALRRPCGEHVYISEFDTCELEIVEAPVQHNHPQNMRISFGPKKSLLYVQSISRIRMETREST